MIRRRFLQAAAAVLIGIARPLELEGKTVGIVERRYSGEIDVFGHPENRIEFQNATEADMQELVKGTWFVFKEFAISYHEEINTSQS